MHHSRHSNSFPKDSSNYFPEMKPSFIPGPQFTNNAMAIFAQQGFTYPPLFVGNIGLENGSHIHPTVYEIKLGDICVLDALHIIPKDITPPTMPKYVGKTRPDLNSRPFTMKMFIRNAENDSIVPVQEWTIQGGVQHLPLPSHIQSIYTDYIGISGDFEILTVAIHGKKLIGKENPIKKLPNQKFPNIAVEYNLKFLENEDQDNSGDEWDYEESDVINKRNNQIEHLRHLSTISVQSFSDRLRKMQGRVSNVMINRFNDLNGGSALDTAQVSLKAIADLIEAIFSTSLADISNENCSSKISDIKSLHSALEACWESSRVSSFAKTASSYDRISALGEDTVQALAQTLIKGLEGLRADIPSIFYAAGAPFHQSNVITSAHLQFLEYGTSIMKLCGSALLNHYTAKAFADSHGLSVICFLIRQQPPLPKNILFEAVQCLRHASCHSDLASMLFEPPPPFVYDDSGVEYPNTDVSGYQTLVFTLGNLSPSANLIIEVAREVIEYAGFYDACKQMSIISETMLKEMQMISEAVGDLSTSGLGNVFEMFNAASRSFDTKERVLKAISSASDTICKALSIIKVFKSGYQFYSRNPYDVDSVSMQSPSLSVGLLQMIEDQQVLTSLTSWAHYITIVFEMSTCLNWESRSSLSLENRNADFFSLIDLLNSEVCIAIAQLITTKNIEIVFTANVEIVQLLFNLLSKKQDILSIESYEELACDIEPLRDHVGEQTLGWIPWLMTICLVSVEKIIVSIPTSDTNDHNSMLAEIENWASNASLEHAISNLEELASNYIGASVVGRVISSQLLNAILFYLDKVCSNISISEILGIDSRHGTILSRIGKLFIVTCADCYDDFSKQKILKKFLQSVLPDRSKCPNNHDVPVFQTVLFELYFPSKEFSQESQDLKTLVNNIEKIFENLNRESKLSSVVNLASNLKEYVRSIKISSSKFMFLSLESIESSILLICKWISGSVTLLKASDAETVYSLDAQGISKSSCAAFSQVLFIEDDVFIDSNEPHNLSVATKAYRSLLIFLHALNNIVDAILILYDRNVTLMSKSFVGVLIHALTASTTDVGICESGSQSSLARLIYNKILRIFRAEIDSGDENRIMLVMQTILIKGMCSPYYLQSCSSIMNDLVTHISKSSNQKRIREKFKSGDFFSKKLSNSNEKSINWSEIIYSSKNKNLSEDPLLSIYYDIFSSLEKRVDHISNRENKILSQQICLASLLLQSTDQCSLALVDVITGFLSLQLTSTVQLLHKKAVSIILSLSCVLSQSESQPLITLLMSKLREGIVLWEELTLYNGNISVGPKEFLTDLCRSLLDVELMLQSPLFTIKFVDMGVIELLFKVLNANDVTSNSGISKEDKMRVIFTALQVLTSIYLELKGLSTYLPDEEFNLIKGRVASYTLRLEAGIVTFIPRLLVRIIESSPWEIIAQVIDLLSILPPCSIKLFVEACTSTLASFEVLAVKLWLAMEEAYQQLNEATEIRKNILSLYAKQAESPDAIPFQLDELLSIDNGEAMVSSAHQAFAASSFCLRVVLEIIYSLYLRGLFSQGSLARAVRASLMFDPRKIALRLQRAYAVWGTEYNSSRHMSSTVRGAYRLNGKGLSQGLEHGIPKVYQHFANNELDSKHREMLFESSNYICTGSLKVICEVVSRSARTLVGKGAEENISENDASIVNVDLSEENMSLSQITSIFENASISSAFREKSLLCDESELFSKELENLSYTNPSRVSESFIRNALRSSYFEDFPIYDLVYRRVNRNALRSSLYEAFPIIYSKATQPIKKKRKVRVTQPPPAIMAKPINPSAQLPPNIPTQPSSNQIYNQQETVSHQSIQAASAFPPPPPRPPIPNVQLPPPLPQDLHSFQTPRPPIPSAPLPPSIPVDHHLFQPPRPPMPSAPLPPTLHHDQPFQPPRPIPPPLPPNFAMNQQDFAQPRLNVPQSQTNSATFQPPGQPYYPPSNQPLFQNNSYHPPPPQPPLLSQSQAHSQQQPLYPYDNNQQYQPPHEVNSQYQAQPYNDSNYQQSYTYPQQEAYHSGYNPDPKYSYSSDSSNTGPGDRKRKSRFN